MSRFDEEPDGDPHGECALEIHRLEARIAELEASVLKITAGYGRSQGVSMSLRDEFERLVDAFESSVCGKIYYPESDLFLADYDKAKAALLKAFSTVG